MVVLTDHSWILSCFEVGNPLDVSICGPDFQSLIATSSCEQVVRGRTFELDRLQLRIVGKLSIMRRRRLRPLLNFALKRSDVDVDIVLHSSLLENVNDHGTLLGCSVDLGVFMVWKEHDSALQTMRSIRREKADHNLPGSNRS